MTSKQRSLFSDNGNEFDAKEFFESLADRLLRRYIERVRSWHRVSPKELNDPVWQTLTVHPVEVVILDSPLLQRLRFIRQLGVAHYVHPGTTHTRLEHSL